MNVVLLGIVLIGILLRIININYLTNFALTDSGCKVSRFDNQRLLVVNLLLQRNNICQLDYGLTNTLLREASNKLVCYLKTSIH